MTNPLIKHTPSTFHPPVLQGACMRYHRGWLYLFGGRKISGDKHYFNTLWRFSVKNLYWEYLSGNLHGASSRGHNYRRK